MQTDIKILGSFKDVEPYIDRVRRAADSERDALGFLPPSAYSEAGEQGKLLVAVDSAGMFCGYLMFGGVFPRIKIMQIYADPHFRKGGVARALMRELVGFAEKRNYLSLSAKVARDLSVANSFYERMGFRIIEERSGGKTRKRIIYHRVRDLDTPRLFDLTTSIGHKPMPNLGISGNYSNKTPIYAIDLNILFDVSKRRVNAKNAELIFRAGFQNDIRPVVAEELIEELKRNTDRFPDDPHLRFALTLAQLPKPNAHAIDGIERDLANIIFAERQAARPLTVQDKSDLRHIATAIHHGVTGFITGEKAILIARDHIESKYGLEVLAASDFADAMASEDNDDFLSRIAQVNETELASNPLTENMRRPAKSFLKAQHVPPDLMDEVLSQGDPISPQRHVIHSGNSGIVTFASWSVTKNPRKIANVFLCGDESSFAISTAIDHTLDQICKEVSSGAPARIHLRILPGHTITRKLALAHGFRLEQGQEAHGTTLHKVSIGSVIDKETWEIARRSLRGLIGAELPPSIPTYEGPDQAIKIKTPKGLEEEIPLRALETLLSPTLFLLPGRLGVIVPIKRIFADDLLGTSVNLSLLTSPEAVLLKERVYYCTPRAAPILLPGSPILFYESSDNNGRKSIVAMGRVTDSHILTSDQVSLDMERKGVVAAKRLKHIGVSEKKLATTFDNIMILGKPVPLDYLRKIGCADGSNFITARRVEHHHLIKIIKEGLGNG